MKTGWRASDQGTPFRRIIVGFDLRKNENLHKFFLTSWNESVRCEDLLEVYANYLSAMNIFSCDPSTIPAINIPKNFDIISFDLPVDYVNKLVQSGVSVPVLSPFEAVAKGWKFLGFDVVDPITQSSGLDSSIFSEASTRDLLRGKSIILNKNGLIDDPDAALKFASALDLRFAEHMPFVPCGVWLKEAL